jgi:hypothetical protein
MYLFQYFYFLLHCSYFMFQLSIRNLFLLHIVSSLDMFVPKPSFDCSTNSSVSSTQKALRIGCSTFSYDCFGLYIDLYRDSNGVHRYFANLFQYSKAMFQSSNFVPFQIVRSTEKKNCSTNQLDCSTSQISKLDKYLSLRQFETRFE